MKTKFFILTFLIAASAILIGREHQIASRMESELTGVRTAQRALSGLRSEHARLKAIQPNEEEVARLRTDIAETEHLRIRIADADRRRSEAELTERRRCELITAQRCAAETSPEVARKRAAAVEAARQAALKRKAARDSGSGTSSVSCRKPEPLPDPSKPYPFGKSLTASQWQNRGAATAEDSLETILWASAGGDLDMLSRRLVLDPASRTRAEDLLAHLPDATRRRYATPEELMTLFVAKEAPLGSLTVLATKQTSPDTALTYASVRSKDQQEKDVCLSFQNSPQGWRLVVPPNAINKAITSLVTIAP